VKTNIAKPNVTEKADSVRLDRVYTALIENLELTENHSNKLKERGLCDSTIFQNQYASVPKQNKSFEIGMALSKNFDLEGVSGFYIQDGCWGLNVNYSGFYIPYRDEQSRIVGLQIRKDGNEEQKYLWLSSSNKEKGCSSGSPLHFVNPEIVKNKREVFITEGALKADIIGELNEVGVVAMGGVNAMRPEELTETLFETFPNLEKVVLAFDMDWEVKEEVKKPLLKLLEALRGKFVSVLVATWDINLGKGYDDVLFKIKSDNLADENLIGFPKTESFLNSLSSERNSEKSEHSENVIKTKDGETVKADDLPFSDEPEKLEETVETIENN